MVTDKRSSQTLKERRLATLRRSGAADRQRVATEKPTAAFFWILIIVSSFVMLGLVMVLSSSSVTNLHSGGSAWGMLQRQLIWAGLGTIAMWAAYAAADTSTNNDDEEEDDDEYDEDADIEDALGIGSW